MVKPPIQKRITIKDVAKEAGVSIAAVSYTINGTGSVGEDVRKRIVETMQRLGYRHNIAGRAMRTGRTNTIGLILPDLTNPFFPELVLAIERAAAKAGYAVFLINSQDSTADELAGLNTLMQHGIDGLIWCPATDVNTMKQAKKTLPVVVIDRQMHGYDCVSSDYFQGGKRLAQCVLQQGHTKIGFISGPKHIESVQDRLAGFKAGLKGGGRVVWTVQTPFAFTLNEAAQAKLRANTDASVIIGGNDMIAIAIVRYLDQLGQSVPQDISVTGFDNTPWSDLVTPALTTLRQPIPNLGQTAVSLLLERMQKPAGRKKKISLETEIVTRSSMIAATQS
ncbi:MAG: LacI family DNA-binding transcriptional regulator [Pseudomonadota bacterium]